MEELLTKFAGDSILLIFLIAVMYFARPVVQRFLDQWVEQLTKQTEQLVKLNNLVETLTGQQETFAERLEHVEDLLGLVAAERRTPVSAASVNQPTRRASRRKAEPADDQ
jgi:Na+-transporting methylmalonyl-CoA/oxaloacetate decarboxylase gamma subunit